LSGEDIFLEKLVAPYYEQARSLLRQRAADAAAFVALNEYYADFMAGYLDVDRQRVHVIPHGLNLDGHGSRAEGAASAPLRVGFLARICPEKGLHLLVEACEQLAERDDAPPFDVHVAGYLGGGDRPYYEELRRRIEGGSLAGRFAYHGELDRAGKIAFLQSLDVMSLPTVYRESKGLSAYEALASGVPVVLAGHGVFPELIAATGGGLLHEPLNARDLADKLAVLLQDATLRAELGRSGQRVVRQRFHARAMAEQTRELYRLVAGVGGPAGAPR
jgi:glycosyltransferase involved in cell wall biosynthesis